MKYHVLWFLLQQFSRLPMGIHYVLGYVYFFLGYRLFSYRKKLVLKNITRSFPLKTPEEIHQIQYLFYKYLFTELIPEMLKSFTISKAEADRIISVKNAEALVDSARQGKGTFIYSAHYTNWEWFGLVPVSLGGYPCYSAYRPLSSAFFEKRLKASRERLGAHLFDVSKAFSFIRSTKYKHSCYLFLSDQRPTKSDSGIWIDFLGQKTAVIKGVETMIRILDVDAYIGFIKRVKKGRYEVVFEPLEMPPDSKDFPQTRAFYRRLEELIYENPQYWLWTHDRWKHSYPSNTA